MPQFRYRALAQGGGIVVGEVEAPSREEVLRRIKYLGHLPIDTEIVTPGILSRGTSIGRKLPRARDVTIFLRQLALLIGAGLPLEAALQTLGTDTSKPLSAFAGAIRASISAGDSFAEALERESAIMEPAYIAMVRAGEASGRLVPVLRAIVEDRTRRELLADRINSAVRYPLFLVAAAIAVLAFFLIYVVPQFEPVFKDLGGKLNAGAAFVLATSAWLRNNLELVLGASALAVLGVLLVLSKREWKSKVVSALGSLPGIAGTVSDRRTARVISTLGLLIENGVGLPATLKILRDVVNGPRYVAAVDRVSELVRNGRRFGDALAETDLLPPLAVRMLKVGDETGDLPSIARHAAEFYEHRLGLGLDRLMGAIGPATIILVSIVIGGLVISIMSALLSITDSAL